MPSGPSNSEDQQYKHHDAGSYDDVADRFEHFTERFSLPMARRVVELARPAAAQRWLDVGCGTGVVARLAAAARPGPERIVGLDLSDGMLRLATRLADAEFGAGRIEFRRGDAEQLEFPDAAFDTVVSLYALRHFPAPQRALQEMARVLKPGGRVVVGIGSAAPRLSADFVHNVLRFAGERVAGLIGRGPLHATAFLDGLVERHAGAQGAAHGTADAVGPLDAALRKAGFRDVRTTWVGQSAALGSAEDFWNLQVTLSTRARKSLPTMGESARAALRRDFDARSAATLARGGRLVYRSGALIATGVRGD